ncbi:MAG TPA: hydrogenase maturation nickel metallochaperone HypA [Pyrinomonadaceae bacterium]|nr:hydrogenase maturation nickel metallochaperone HypA [Pyrinomonadaceae bacterium]
MHELGITRSVVAICAENSNGAAVKRVTLEIGKLSAIMPDAVRFCFDICAKGTVVEGATLEILEISGLAKCKICGEKVELKQIVGRCICGSNDLQIIAGEELKVKEMET